jgi:hypothetical protein
VTYNIANKRRRTKMIARAAKTHLPHQYHPEYV